MVDGTHVDGLFEQGANIVFLEMDKISKIKHYLKLKSLRIWIWAVEAGKRKCGTKSLELKVMQKSFQYMCKAAGHSQQIVDEKELCSYDCWIPLHYT